MKPIYALTIASAKMFLRSRQALFFSLFTPLIIMFIFGSIGFDKPQKIDVGLVTHRPTLHTTQFVDQIKQVSSFSIEQGTLEQERAKLDAGKLTMVLDIPDELMSMPAPGSGPRSFTAYLNGGQPMAADSAIYVLNQLIDKTTLYILHAPTLFTVNQQTVNSRNMRYIEFLLPGLIALSVMQMSVFSVAFVFTQYKEKGVLKRLLATPMLPHQFVIANVITRMCVAVSQAVIFILLGTWIFKVHIVGSFPLILLCVTLGAVMFLGLGFTVSGLAKTVDAVPVIANLVVFPMLFLGNIFFSSSNMPPWLATLANLLPLSYFATALRDVMTKGAGFFDIKWNLLGMAIWGLALVTIATLTFSFQDREAV
jgi:ABC-2 type transport system permease protein